jgi:AraC family transcriptional activator of mtrCDE
MVQLSIFMLNCLMDEELDVDQTDWLSRLLEMIPVSGVLDLRCFLAAPWRIEYEQSPSGEIPYHVVIGGSAVLEAPPGTRPRKLTAGDIVLLTDGAPHTLQDGSGALPLPLRERRTLSVTISENDGTGDRLDMLCGRFILSPVHGRMLHNYFPRRIFLRAAENGAEAARPGTRAAVAQLAGLMRFESAAENLGGRAMLNALSTALFAVALRLASETSDAPAGLLALAANPRLAPSLNALFNEPARPWTLPELARLSNMSRATFIRHFQEKLGWSASDLLTDIRMTVASNALKRLGISTAEAAQLAGYQSEAAFQRAFKQRVGITPAQLRHRTRTSDESAPA